MYIKVSIVLVLVCLSITSSSLKISNKILSNIVIGSSSLALLFSPIHVNADDNVLIGSYRDPAHTGCSRLISSSKGRLLISGSDHKNGAGKWAVQASSKEGNIVVDFTNGVVLQDWHSPSVDFPGSFEGKQDVIGKFDGSVNGIKWDDGSIWYKTSIANSLVDGSGSGFTSSKYKSI